MIILIDYENVGENGFLKIKDLKYEDRLILFYNSTSKIYMSTHENLEKLKCKKEYKMLEKTRKNALDFQLASYLGYLIRENQDEEFIILSNDTGFDSLIEFWKGINIKRDTINIKENNTKNINTNELNIKVQEAIKEKKLDFTVDSLKITAIISKYKTKQGINNAIMKLYDSKKTGQINSAIKSLIKDKKGK